MEAVPSPPSLSHSLPGTVPVVEVGQTVPEVSKGGDRGM